MAEVLGRATGKPNMAPLSNHIHLIASDHIEHTVEWAMKPQPGSQEPARAQGRQGPHHPGVGPQTAWGHPPAEAGP